MQLSDHFNVEEALPNVKKSIVNSAEHMFILMAAIKQNFNVVLKPESNILSLKELKKG